MTIAPFSTIEKAIDELQAGRMVILVDDEDRENEGDLVIAADYITPEAINFMATHGRGLICLSMNEALVDKLGLPLMVARNRSPFGTAFTVSIEAAEGVTTGISAADRARTIKVAIDAATQPDDLISPGHVFPLRACRGGVLKRTGQTEGSVDLATLAGLTSAAVICEIINDDGTMSRRGDLELFSKRHHIPMISIGDLIKYRIAHEKLIEVEAESRLPIAHYGDFLMTVYRNDIDEKEHFSLLKPRLNTDTPFLVRIHSECLTGDIFGSCKCDCGSQLQQSLAMIAKEGGLLIYLRQEGRGIGLANKLRAYALQDKGLDTVEANEHLGLPIDSRDYGVAIQILKYHGIERIRLLTNNPIKIASIEAYGIEIAERISLMTKPTKENEHYLKVKKEKLGHFLEQ